MRLGHVDGLATGVQYDMRFSLPVTEEASIFQLTAGLHKRHEFSV